MMTRCVRPILEFKFLVSSFTWSGLRSYGINGHVGALMHFALLSDARSALVKADCLVGDGCPTEDLFDAACVRHRQSAGISRDRCSS